jgi:hypothetical protein
MYAGDFIRVMRELAFKQVPFFTGSHPTVAD